jgi:myo-inositol-1(or 4)-monophosphatase
MTDILERIDDALDKAVAVLRNFKSGAVKADDKGGGDPVTEADRAVDNLLREILPRDDEGWLSEETADNPERLKKTRVWIVDPLDGTREFVQGIPEWVVSIGLTENGRAIAGGICNPDTGEKFLGGHSVGIFYNGKPAEMSKKLSLDGAIVPASRSEVRRGEWDKFNESPITVKPMGSVAYKLALLAVGKVDANWTLVPKHEWDVAAGVALVEAAGGFVRLKTGGELSFNNENTLLPGLWAGPAQLHDEIKKLLMPYLDL